jgi:hypothetical protein
MLVLGMAASPASGVCWARGAPRLSGLSLPSCAWPPPLLFILRGSALPSPPAAKTESKFCRRCSPNFLRCKFATEIRWRLGRTVGYREWAISEGEEGTGRSILARSESLGKVVPFPFFSATLRSLILISFQAAADAQPGFVQSP